MTATEKLNRLSILINDSEIEDEVLLTYLDLAAEGICRKAYPFDSTRRDVPDKYSMLQVDIALYLFSKRGAEGQLSHNENGVSRSYESAYIPTSMLRSVTPLVGVF